MKRTAPNRTTWERSPVKRRLPVTDVYRVGKSGPRAACPDCGLLYRDKRWALERREKPRKGEPLPPLLCPACRKIRSGDFYGEVVLTGPWLAQHGREIEAVILNEEAKAMGDNPLERIMESRWQGKRLAQRIGRSVHGAFKGALSVDIGRADAPARVRWER